MKYRFKGFTLIELLIVVAIIGILAAIAIPNFLQAQVRSKVARSKADQRTLATQLELYRTDNNTYVPDPTWWFGLCPTGMSPCGPGIQEKYPLRLLTTPVEYASNLPTDAFPNRTDFPPDEPPQYRYFSDISWKPVIQESKGYPDTPYKFALVTTGPDQISNVGEYLLFGEEVLNSIPGLPPPWNFNDGALYDPTNGTISDGDIVRIGP